jgi:hypothetical protein
VVSGRRENELHLEKQREIDSTYDACGIVVYKEKKRKMDCKFVAYGGT